MVRDECRQRCRRQGRFSTVMLTLAAATLVASCTSIDCCLAIRSDTPAKSRYVVIGLGVVDVAKTPDPRIMAIQSTTLGISAATFPASLALGYGSFTLVSIPADVPDTYVEAGYCSTGLGVRKHDVKNPR